jgi:hypothetical protein
VVGIHTTRVVPSEEAVLAAMGVPSGNEQGERVEKLVADAIDELLGTACPRSVIASVTDDEFAAIYEGEGDNEVPSPLAEIFPRSESLILFAATLGAPLSERIASLFDDGSLALAAMLDAAASEATELAGVHLDRMMLRMAREAGLADTRTRALRYSPGYCGWNLTGQRALFAALDAGEIGVTLTDSCLMEPLKSISGVIVLGPAEIHEFDDDYTFCSSCRTRDCRRRISELKHGPS